MGSMPGVNGEIVGEIRERVASQFSVPVRTVDLPDPEFAFHRERGQYASATILESLLRGYPADGLRFVGITDRDLFMPVLTFVYGHAQLGGRVAIVSTARLGQEFYGMPPNRGVLVQRSIKEVLHEAGHTFGLVHCHDRSCVMALATNIRQLDSKRDAFCAPCAGRLGRLIGESQR